MNELTQKIEQWAFDRNLQTADPIKQFDKLVEEYGELVQGLNKNNMDLIKDSIGDMYVVLVVMSTQLETELPTPNKSIISSSTIAYTANLGDLGIRLEDNHYPLIMVGISNLLRRMMDTCMELNIDFKECVQIAYEEIKDRKGRMIDGKFVKESDLKETPEDKLQSNKETRHPNKYMD